MSTMTDRLFVAGFITRKIDPSACRRNVLELTVAGRAQLDANFDARNALGHEDAQELFDLARRLLQQFGGKDPGAPQA